MKRPLSSSEEEETLSQGLAAGATLNNLPPEVLENALVRLETVQLLEIVSTNKQVRAVIEDDSFWRRKLFYDFPELVEFVGTRLPEWVSDSVIGFGPWRRYYYTTRYFMRKVYKALMILAERVAPVCIANPLVDLPFCPFYLQSPVLAPGHTRTVKLFEYARNRVTGQRNPGSGIRRAMDINAFCAKYLLYSPEMSVMYNEVMEYNDPFHYSRRPETVNPIRVLMLQLSSFEAMTHDAVFNMDVFADIFRRGALRKFLGWILHLNPAFDPFANLRGLPSPRDYIQRAAVGDNVWTRHIDAPEGRRVPDPQYTLAEVTSFCRSRAMQYLWRSMRFSEEGDGELRMTTYDSEFLTHRSSYIGFPRDQRGRLLIGAEIPEH